MSESPPSSPQRPCSEYRRQLPLQPLGSAGSAAGCTAAGLDSVRLHIGAGHLWRPLEQRFRRPVRPWRRQGERLAQHELWWVLGWCGRRRPFLNPRAPSSPLPAPHSSAPSPPLALSGPFFHVPFAQPPGFVFVFLCPGSIGLHPASLCFFPPGSPLFIRIPTMSSVANTPPSSAQEHPY